MKRKALTIIIIAAVALIFAGNFSWNQKVENTAKEAEERISAPVNKGLSAKENSADLSSNTSKADIDSSPSTNKNTDKSPNNNTETGTAKNGDNSTLPEDESKPSNDENTKPTLEGIKTEYYSIFSELEEQEASKVDQLIVEAKADFVSNKAPIGELITKYQELSVLMEKNADKAFNIVYQQLQYDLQTNGYDIEEAQEFKETYDSKKQERLSRVLNQISDF